MNNMKLLCRTMFGLSKSIKDRLVKSMNKCYAMNKCYNKNGSPIKGFLFACVFFSLTSTLLLCLKCDIQLNWIERNPELGKTFFFFHLFDTTLILEKRMSINANLFRDEKMFIAKRKFDCAISIRISTLIHQKRP